MLCLFPSPLRGGYLKSFAKVIVVNHPKRPLPCLPLKTENKKPKTPLLPVRPPQLSPAQLGAQDLKVAAPGMLHQLDMVGAGAHFQTIPRLKDAAHLAIQGEVEVLDLFIESDGHGHRL